MSDLRSRVLVVFIDALGPEQLERYGPGFDSLPHRRAVRGVLGYSSGALATLLTGAPGSAHGRMCLFSARREGEPGVLDPLSWLGLLPRIVHERGRLRRLAARLLAKRAGLTGYVALHRVPPSEFRWLDLPERDDLFQAADVGGVPTFLSRARKAGLCVYASPWQLPEADRWKEAHAALARNPPDLAFLYAPELDGALHREGSDGPAARAVRTRLVAQISRARDAMDRGGRPLLTLVVGDHGMADVHTAIDPGPVLSRLGGARVFVDSTMLRLWGDGPALSRAREAIARTNVAGQWLDGDALSSRGAPVEGNPYGSAIFLLDQGCIFAPSYVGGRAAGMHGYDLNASSAYAAVASDAPLPDSCERLEDLAPAICRKLELPS